MAATPGGEAPALILLVDDYEDSRMLYAEFLLFSGFRVAQAADGAEAIRMATELLPDLIVMDLSLPVVDGWEAIERLRSNGGTGAIPIIALTGHSRVGREVKCDAVLAKPCLPDELLAHVKKLLGKRVSPSSPSPGTP